MTAVPALPPMLFALAFVFGAILGSFLNVCIWRVPRDESIVHPGSHCPHCGTPVRPFDNIPLLSYALLRGRCRQCATPIGFRYPLVEILMGLLTVVLLDRFGLSPAFAVYTVFTAALVVVSFIDLDHQIIPDVISLPGIGVGLACSLLGIGPSIIDSAVGTLLGGGLLLAVAVGYHALTKREGMGGGDIKLLAMIGAFLGWRAVLVTLVLGSLSGAIVGAALIVGRGTETRVPIPFGPFLALGAICALLFGDPLIEWYLNFALYGVTQ
jgi:leader peptidase (prepilin peptidase)/N-methyltransferase